MTEKVSKALKEVWEWKEAVYEETKHMTTRERLEYIRNEANLILEEEGMEKVKVKEGVYLLRKKTPEAVAEKRKEYDAEASEREKC